MRPEPTLQWHGAYTTVAAVPPRSAAHDDAPIAIDVFRVGKTSPFDRNGRGVASPPEASLVDAADRVGAAVDAWTSPEPAGRW